MKNGINVLALMLDNSGHVVLTDNTAIELEAQLQVSVGGNGGPELITTTNHIFCDKDITNTYNCQNQSNFSCENDWMCQGSSNTTDCSNAVNCTGQGGQNPISCTNATTSGCSP